MKKIWPGEVEKAIASLLGGIPFYGTDFVDSKGSKWDVRSLFTVAGHPRTLWFKDGLLVHTDEMHGAPMVAG